MGLVRSHFTFSARPPTDHLATTLSRHHPTTVAATTAPSTVGPCHTPTDTAIALMRSYTLTFITRSTNPTTARGRPERASRPPRLCRGRPMDHPTTVAHSRARGRCPATFHLAKRAAPFGGWSYAAEEEWLGMGPHQLVSAGRRPV